MSEDTTLNLSGIWPYLIGHYEERPRRMIPRLGKTHPFKLMGQCELVLQGTLPHEIVIANDEDVVVLSEQQNVDEWALEKTKWKFVPTMRKDVDVPTLSGTIQFFQSKDLGTRVDRATSGNKRPLGLKFRLVDSSDITSPKDRDQETTLLVFRAEETTGQKVDVLTGKFESTCRGRLFRDGIDTAIGSESSRANDAAAWAKVGTAWWLSTESDDEADDSVGEADELVDDEVESFEANESADEAGEPIDEEPDLEEEVRLSDEDWSETCD